jgi:hypothetical protein
MKQVKNQNETAPKKKKKKKTRFVGTKERNPRKIQTNSIGHN